jgi:hypothetical protein
MRPNNKGGKNTPLSLASQALTSNPTVRTIEVSEEPSRGGELLNCPQDRSGWQALPHHGKLSYRRKHSCYPFLDDLFQRVRYRCQTVLIYA